MKAIDNTGLQILGNIIIESFSTSGIYCFGEKKLIQEVQNLFQESASKQEEQTRFINWFLPTKTNLMQLPTLVISLIPKQKVVLQLRYCYIKASSVQYLTPHK